MAVKLNPYLTFRDGAREAMTFYRSVFGGELVVTTFGEAGAVQDPGDTDLVLHSQLEGEHGVVLMASDLPARMPYQPGSTISISLSGDDAGVLTEWFDKLSDGGNVSMPLAKAPWGDTFGMCTDRYGTDWLVNIAGTPGD